MSQTSETQLTEAPAPWAQKPRDRRALSAYRHGLTGQIILLTDADRAAYEKHCQGYHLSFAPRGPVETDLVQAVANDRWRLNHAACLESSIFADGITQPDEVTSGNAEVTPHCRRGPGSRIPKGSIPATPRTLQSHIQHRFRKEHGEDPDPPVGSQDRRRNYSARRSHFRKRRSGHCTGAGQSLDFERRQPPTPRTLRKPHPTPLRKEHGGDPASSRSNRKTFLEQLLEEADLLCQLAESKGEEADPSQFITLTRFDFSGLDVIRLVTRRRALREARKKFQDPRKPSKIAAEVA